MLSLQNIIFSKQALHQGRVNMLVFTVLTVVSLLFAQTTVFYLLYFFWWNELIRLVVDRFCYKQNINAVYEKEQSLEFGQGLFLMGMYWVFLVVLFGYVAGAKNNKILIANMEVLFFHNWFFNSNLIFVLLERLYLHKKQHPLRVYFGAFNPNTIVLHISIIVGAVLMFFVVKNYPNIFTPQNLWGSALIALPFLLLKMAMQYLMAPDNTINKQNSK